MAFTLIHGNQFSNYENYAILKGMDRTTLTDFFEEVETTEEYNGYFCSIAEAISIVVLGSLCGFKNVSQIHQWAESAHAREFLKEKFGIKHVPCYYWLLVLLKMVKPDTLNTCLMKWAAQYLPADRSQTTISLYGKTIRSTTGMKNIESPMHIISAQICEFGVTLASETVDEKSNEIPAVQELLKKLDIEGCLVVADALNCQKETAESIVSGKGDYLLAAKGNQPSLEQEISDYVQDETLRKGMDSAVKKRKTATGLKHGRHTLSAIFPGCSGRKSGKISPVSAQSGRKSRRTGRKQTNGTTISPAESCRRRSCFITPEWSGQWRQCTGYSTCIMARISAELRIKQFSKT